VVNQTVDDLAAKARAHAEQIAVGSMKERALDALRSPAERAEHAANNEERNRSQLLKWVLIGTGALVLVVAALALMAKLWKLAMLTTIVGGLGFAAYLVVRPKLAALKARMEQGRLAAQAEEQAAAQVAAQAAAAQAVTQQKVAAAQKLDDDLAALKNKFTTSGPGGV
jgi:ABC-type multidrug transport system fused ATPase/permease subunit